MSIAQGGRGEEVSPSEKTKRMTVAHINGSFFLGSETFIYNYISHHKRFKPICLASEFVNIDQFPFPADDMMMLSASRKKYSLPGLYYAVWRRYRARDPWLTRQLRSRECGIIHAHFGHNGCHALAAKKELATPLVTTFYGFDISDRAVLAQYEKRYEELFRDGDLFLALGPRMRERLIERGCPPHKVKVQRIAIPVGRFPLRLREPRKKGEKVRILFTGRLVEKKGLVCVLQAINKVKAEYADFYLRIAGEGPLRPHAESYVRENNLGEYVHFLGFLPYREYLAEMEAADLFILPSVTAENGNSEGTPTVILEAQAHGLPVISTYHADIPYILVPGKSALLSQERDIDSLAGNISYLLKNQDAWAVMGDEGRRFVEEYHDIEKEIDVLEERYEELVER